VVDLGVAFAEPFLEVALGNANGWVATHQAWYEPIAGCNRRAPSLGSAPYQGDRAVTVAWCRSLFW
jgi:hypothetical protein